jgi:hypothetical protein
MAFAILPDGDWSCIVSTQELSENLDSSVTTQNSVSVIGHGKHANSVCLALAGSVDAVATKVGVSLSPEQRNEIVVQLEDASFPDEAAKIVAEEVPNLESLVTQANVEALQITLGVLTSLLLAALLVASFIPRIRSEDANAQRSREAVADVSSRRI